MNNLATLAESSLERLGERRTLVFEGESYSNKQFLERARRLHAGLAERGIGRGDIAALCLTNHPDVYPVFQGVFRTGAAALPVMPQLAPPELQFILDDTRARCVFTDAANLEKVRQVAQELPAIELIVIRDAKNVTSDGGESLARAVTEVSLAELLAHQPRTELPEIPEDDLALMLYTSGTTGRPKGAMLSHGNLIASARQSADAAELETLEAPRISISAMPMAHIFGVGVMNGGYLVPERLADGYMVQMSWFEPERFMALVEEHRCSSMPAVPTMLALILNHPKNAEYDLSSLEEVVCGAAPLPVELANAFAARYGCRLREIYGMTESAGIASANRPSDAYRPGSAGRAYSETELRIVDDSGAVLPAGERGEVVLKGPTVMMGYMNRPEATAEAIQGGWLHTGDVGYLDEEGFLFIVDRKKDMIIKGGENIYPAELESILYQHPAVAEAAIVGAPDETYGEKVVGFVALKGGAQATEAELVGFVKEHTMPFKAPSAIQFVDALPKSGVGKILRRELRGAARS